MKHISVFFVTLLLSGCAGTIVTRFGGSVNDPHFGAYPYQAPVIDLKLMGAGGKLGLFEFEVGILSLPLDIAIDTVFLPVDLIMWTFGCKKNQE